VEDVGGLADGQPEVAHLERNAVEVENGPRLRVMLPDGLGRDLEPGHGDARLDPALQLQ